MAHIQNCFHPNTFRNPFTGDDVTARCGKCDACRNLRADNWVKRLDMESSCHKYTWFFTLTYDDFNVPQIVRLPFDYTNKKSFIYYDSQTDEIFDSFDIKEGFEEKDIDYCKQTEVLNVLSKRDFQLFFKRLRYYFNQTEKGATLRYYICGEYGPRTYRPHGHCLLFLDSKRCSDILPALLFKAWTNEFGQLLGNIYDPHIVSGSAAEYCASYINSAYRLPRMYLHKGLRPFTLFSKCPAIGTLYPSTKETQKLFFDANSTFTIFDPSSNSFKDVPLWRSLEAGLFPRLQRFSSLFPSDRIALYRKIQEFPPHLTAREIAARIKSEYIDTGRQDFFGRYFREIAFKKVPVIHFRKQSVGLDWKVKDLPFLPKDFQLDRPIAAAKSVLKEYNEQSLIRFVSVINRVRHQARIFGVSIDFYVSQIEKYYDKKSAQRLRDDYNFQDVYFSSHPKWHIIYFDRGFFNKVTETSYSVLTNETKTYLSYLFDGKVPLKTVYHLEDGSKDVYLDIPNYNSLSEFNSFVLLHRKIAHDLVKQKENNDYVLARSNQYQNIINYQNLKKL